MKHLFLVIVALLIANPIYPQDVRLLPEWKLTLQILNEAGMPIRGADVEIGHFVSPPSAESEGVVKHTGLTDANGLFIATGRAQDRLYCNAKATGYYKTALRHDLGIVFDKPRHEPWNPTLQLVLKRIKAPIAMYAKWIDGGPPVFNQPAAYDLSTGDWVAPHGKGLTGDMIFFGHLDKKAEDDFVYILHVSFPNSGDGIQEFAVPYRFDEGSELRSPHEAPLTAYQPKVIRTIRRQPGQSPHDDSDPARNYFFRIRTVLDEKGNVKSALYGKVYGDFMRFRYYLNPTPNSRNMEFDPKKNLFSTSIHPKINSP